MSSDKKLARITAASTQATNQILVSCEGSNVLSLIRYDIPARTILKGLTVSSIETCHWITLRKFFCRKYII